MQQVEAKLQRSSSSRSITEDDDAAGAPSVFLFLRYYENKRFSIQQLQLNQDGLPPGDDPPKERVRFRVAKEEEDRHIQWFFSPPASSTGDLYVLPKWKSFGFSKPKHACKFNIQTRSIQQIDPTPSPICNGNAVNLGGRLYFLELYPDIAFQCHDPATGSWKPLKPFPDPPSPSRILATAVLSDTILFNVANLNSNGPFFCSIASSNLWVYDVCGNEWYPVDDGGDWCCSIEGEAVVVDNTIYALTSLDSDSVLALSIKKKESGHVPPKFACSVVSRIRMKGLTPKFLHDETWFTTRHLVHLGKDDFCLVQSCLPVGVIEYQPMHLTYIKREGNSMKLMRVHELEMEPRFELLQVFSLPKGMTFALEKGNCLVLQLDSFSDTFESTHEDGIDSDNHSDNTDSHQEPEVVKPVQEDENMTLPIEDEGHSIHVKNLPSNVNDAQLEKALKKFGPVKRGGIKIGQSTRRNSWYANVEFESATSKQHAIKASNIEIGGCRAKILDRAQLPPTALEEGKRFIFELDPFTAEGHTPIYVGDLRPNVTDSQVEKGLEDDGSIKRDGIEVKKDIQYVFPKRDIQANNASVSSVSMEEHQRVLQELKDVKEQMKKMQAYISTISPGITFTDIQVPQPAPRSSSLSPPVL